MNVAWSERLTHSLTLIEKTAKIRYYGIGFIWAWLYCAYSTPALFGSHSNSLITTNPSWVASAAIVIIAFFAGGFLLRKQSADRITNLHFLAPLALAIGTVFSTLDTPNEEVFSMFGGILTGVGYAILSLLWAISLQKLNQEDLEVVIPCSGLVIVPCIFIFPLLNNIAGVIATALLPIVSGFLLILCVQDNNLNNITATQQPPTSQSQWYLFLVRASVILMFVYVVIGWQSSQTDVVSGIQNILRFDLTRVLSSFTGIVLCILMIFYSRKVSFAALFQWILPALIIALILFLNANQWAQFGTEVIIAACDSLIEIIIYLLLISNAQKYPASVSLGVGVLNGALQLGVLGGNLLDIIIPSTISSETIAMCLVCIIAVLVVFIPQQKPFGDFENKMNAIHETEDASRLKDSHALLQNNHNLTVREIEIALMVAQGHSRSYIREKLFISKNTVSTHIKHIYRKLNIHSREELIEMIGLSQSNR